MPLLLRRPAGIALTLLLCGLLVRILFWQATADADWAYSAYYKGDAPLWQDFARAAAAGQEPVELRIPLRPPGMHWLTSALWNGSDAGAPGMRLLMVLLGALVAPLLYLVLRRSFAERVAVLAGGLTALSSGLLALGSSINNEIPYLLLWLLTMADGAALREQPTTWRWLRWSGLHGLACLFRVEHALFYLLWLLWLVIPQGRRGLRGLLLSLGAFTLVLLPWQIAAWHAVDDFNTAPLPGLPMPGALPWQPEALAGIRELPAFQQQSAFGFVDACVRHRGRATVRAEDLTILEDAYGSRPEPLSAPFVALYGPLNFWLANNEDADGGFDSHALDRPPPLRGGAETYAPQWLDNLPRDGRLALSYPLHLRYVNDGYGLGLRWVLEHPNAALGLGWSKLQQFWRGAAMGFGGFGLPVGLGGERRRVDLAVAEGPLATAWRLLVLVLCIAGAIAGARLSATAPWLLLLVSKLLVTLAFFGYARQGAACFPVVALLLALCAERWLLPRWPDRRWRAIGLSLLLGLCALEVARWISRPTLTIDGQDITAGDPFPPRSYAIRTVRAGAPR